MRQTYTVACLAGDGLGPELMAEASRTLRKVARMHGFEVEDVHAPFGSEALTRSGHPLPATTRTAVLDADAVLVADAADPALGGIEPDLDLRAGLTQVLVERRRPRRAHTGSTRRRQLDRGTRIRPRTSAAGTPRRRRPRRRVGGTRRRGRLASRRRARSAHPGRDGAHARLRARAARRASWRPEWSPPRSATWPWAATATAGWRRQAAWQGTGRRCSRPPAPNPRDSAGQGVADPGSMLLAVSLLLREGLGEEHAADTLASALRQARADGSGSLAAVRRTLQASTRDFGDAVVKMLPAVAPQRRVRARRRRLDGAAHERRYRLRRCRSGRRPRVNGADALLRSPRGRGRRGHVRPPRRGDPADLRRDRTGDDDPPRSRPPRAGRRSHGRGLRTRIRQGRRRAGHVGPGRDQPGHADRGRVDGLDAARLHHRPGAHAPDRHRCVPGVRHRRRDDPDREALVARAGRRGDPARAQGGVPRRAHRPLRPRPRRHPARRAGGGDRLPLSRRARSARLEAATACAPAAGRSRGAGAGRRGQACALRGRRHAQRRGLRRAPRVGRDRPGAGRHDADGERSVPGDARALLRLARHARAEVVELGDEHVRPPRRRRRAFRRPRHRAALGLRTRRERHPPRHRLRRDRQASRRGHPGRRPAARGAGGHGSRASRPRACPAHRDLAASARRVARRVTAPVRERTATR